MKLSIRRPLFAQVLIWLFLHLLILSLAFFGFVRWQLGLGLESLLGGAANERLLHFAQDVSDEIEVLRPNEWDDAIAKLAEQRGVTARVLDLNQPRGSLQSLPGNVVDRIRVAVPVRPELAIDDGPFPRGRESRPGDEDHFDRSEGEGRPEMPPVSDAGSPAQKGALDNRAIFLMRGDGGDGYWAGIVLREPASVPPPRPRPFLLIRSDRLDGAGMFFDLKPWWFGGVAVLVLSILIWAPFVWGITRYIRKLTAATNRIASGRFDVSLPQRGNDELGQLGNTMKKMAGRLDHLISGQKSFLGDAAHELCAPLARIRTGLGVLENRVPETEAERFESIDEDVSELATLVDEILDFSRAGNREPVIEEVDLEQLVKHVADLEGRGLSIRMEVESGLIVRADRRLLGRAVGNLVRNAGVHGGPDVEVTVEAADQAGVVELSVSDNGPGVPADELPRLFEPFYRVDRSRSRDTGGNGLGLAIVRGAVEACGGEVEAMLAPGGGFRVVIRLPQD